ncbi:MAG: glycosyltransferase family 4 protein [Chitinophagaceae bacterium]|nr:glycosyltransferase family 4 protein [Chitinophagaceae bacterium]
MRILYIHTRYMQSMGGEDTTVEAESELMRSKGHDVRLHLFDNAEVVGGTVGKLKAGASAIYNRASAAEIKKVVREFNPDVVHVHNFFFAASPSILVAVKKMNIPLVTTIQNYRLICANALLLRNNKVCELCVHSDFPWWGVKYKCYHHSSVQSAAIGAMAAVHKWRGTWKNAVDLYITPSAFLRNRHIDSSFGVPGEKISVKRNFIADPGVADASSRKNFFLFVGRLSTEKGVHVLLEAWQGLPGDQLMIAGDGPERENLEKKYGEKNNISFVGKKSKDDVIALMKQSKALIFPSIWYEGLPLTIVEALATGTPVIGSDLGAISEMINDGKNGLLFEAGSPGKLEDAIGRFKTLASASDSNLYNGARTSYLEYYHPDKCYLEVMRLYHQLIENKSRV